MKHKLITFVMATACLVQAFDWSGYKLTEEKLPPVTIVNGNFEKGGEGWKLNDEHKVVRGEGINLSSGLVIERTDPNQYALCGQHVKGCVPGQAYNISVRVRCVNVQGGTKGATIGIVHTDRHSGDASPLDFWFRLSCGQLSGVISETQRVGQSWELPAPLSGAAGCGDLRLC